ncbi:hypothetical protein [Microbacterium enclense]|uniref:hypothetical protein n=1 Tax=Microbacterium enclense TaxID=993073 RepID=UPI003F81E5FC
MPPPAPSLAETDATASAALQGSALSFLPNAEMDATASTALQGSALSFLPKGEDGCHGIRAPQSSAPSFLPSGGPALARAIRRAGRARARSSPSAGGRFRPGDKAKARPRHGGGPVGIRDQNPIAAW